MLFYPTQFTYQNKRGFFFQNSFCYRIRLTRYLPMLNKITYPFSEVCVNGNQLMFVSQAVLPSSKRTHLVQNKRTIL